MIIATVVREHADVETAVLESKDAARAWLVKALYLVEDGTLPADAPTPSLLELDDYARDLGWDIHLRDHG